MRILEANAPAAGLIVEDGSSTDTVDPTSSIFVGPGLVLTQPSPGEAEIALPIYEVFTPTISAIPGSGTDPSIGGGGTPFGRFCKLNQFVHYYGSMFFGSGLTSGTGLWQIDLPVPVTIPTAAALGEANITSISSLSVGKQMQMQAQQNSVGAFTPADDQIAFYYLDAYPYGNLVMFDHTSPYSIGNGDVLTWNIVYQADT